MFAIWVGRLMFIQDGRWWSLVVVGGQDGARLITATLEISAVGRPTSIHLRIPLGPAWVRYRLAIMSSSSGSSSSRAAQSQGESRSESLVTSDKVHLDHLQTCLDLSLKCEVSPTAFCVGSILVLPPPHRNTSSGPGLVLSTGYSREPPRPTSHAESSAVYKLLALSKEELGQLLDKQQGERWEGSESWSTEDLLKRVDCYTTLEPCSIRTSGQPDCARLLAKYQVNRVFLGVEEPPDFVDCAGSRLLTEAGVNVYRVVGLEKECLEYARRGRDD